MYLVPVIRKRFYERLCTFFDLMSNSGLLIAVSDGDAAAVRP